MEFGLHGGFGRDLGMALGGSRLGVEADLLLEPGPYDRNAIQIHIPESVPPLGVSSGGNATLETGAGAPYSSGQALVVFRATPPNNSYPADPANPYTKQSVMFRVDNFGGMGLAGGMHVATGLNVPTSNVQEHVWIDGSLVDAIALLHNQAPAATTNPVFIETSTGSQVVAVLAGGGIESASNVIAQNGVTAKQAIIGNFGANAGLMFGTALDTVLFRTAGGLFQTVGGLSLVGSVTTFPNLGTQQVASQTANIANYGNSSGSPIALIDTLGGMWSNSVVVAGNGSVEQVGMGNVGSAGFAAIGFGNAVDTTLLRLAAGQLQTSGTLNVVSNASAGAAAIVLLSKGVASQTGDFFEAQTSTGSVLAKIDSSGDVGAGMGQAYQTVIGTFFGGASVIFGSSADAAIFRAAAGQLSCAGTLVVANGASAGASAVVLTAKEVASQTGDVFDMTSSTGAVLAGHNAAGQCIVVAGNTSATATAGTATLPTNPVGFEIKVVAGTSRKVPYYAT